MTLKAGTALAGIAFGATLAYYIGSRVSTDALNLAVGVLCGVGASLPVSIGLLLALFRRREGDAEEAEGPVHYPQGQGYSVPRQQVPQVIVLAPQQGQYPAGFSPYGFPGPGMGQYPNQMLEQPGEVIDGRDWRVIGDDS